MIEVRGKVRNLRELTRRGVTREIFSQHLKYLDDVVYPDVVDQRVKNKLCGYPLCDNILTSGQDPNRWRIQEAERQSYCSVVCFRISMNLSALLEIGAFRKENVSSHYESLDRSYLFVEDYSSAACDVEELCAELENLHLDEASEIDTTDTSVHDDGLEFSMDERFGYVSTDTDTESEFESEDDDSTYSDESEVYSPSSESEESDSDSDSEVENIDEQCRQQEIEMKVTNRRMIIPVRRVNKN